MNNECSVFKRTCSNCAEWSRSHAYQTLAIKRSKEGHKMCQVFSWFQPPHLGSNLLKERRCRRLPGQRSLGGAWGKFIEQDQHREILIHTYDLGSSSYVAVSRLGTWLTNQKQTIQCIWMCRTVENGVFRPHSVVKTWCGPPQSLQRSRHGPQTAWPR